MKKILTLVALGTSLMANDIIVKESCRNVSETADNIRTIVSKKGLATYAIINHSGNAKMVNLKLNESKMVVFGSPSLGTNLMQQDMTAGLDLPLRVLVYKDSDGKVKMAYRDGSWIANKHIVNAPKKVEKINKGMEEITTQAGQCKKG